MSDSVNIWQAIKQHPFLAVLPAVVLLALGVAWGLARKPTFTATSRLYVLVPSSDPAALFSLTDAASGLASAYSRAADSNTVVAAVARDLKNDPGVVAGTTAATPVPSSPVVKVIATGSSASRAVRLANTTAAELRNYVATLNNSDTTARAALAAFSAATRRVTRIQARVQELEAQLNARGGSSAQQSLDNARADLEVAKLRREASRATFTSLEGTQHPTLEPLRKAAGATSDKRSKLELFGFLGLLAGAVGGTALATLASSVGVRLRSGDEVAGALGLPLLARIPEPRRRDTKRMRLVMLESPQGSHAEALRNLRTNLEFAMTENDIQVIMFVSAVGMEGKSPVAANLGVALARLGERVVVVDLDLRRPRLDRYFRISNKVGLSDVVLGHTTVQDAITSVPLTTTANGRPSTNGTAAVGATLDVLTTGELPPNPGEFVGSPKLPAVFEELRQSYQVVLVDTPAALAVGDALAMSSFADALVVVAKPGSLSRTSIRDFQRILQACPTPAIGVVATGAPAATHFYS